jgi:trk system potassium uptake protein TrkH
MPPRFLSPARLLVASFAGLILTGTLLLALPLAGAHGAISLIDAFFTATSAICVTGLIVVDTPNALSYFGQVVLMLLIQAGGLGYMTLSTAILAVLGRRVSFHARMTLQESLNLDSREGLIRFAFTVLKFTLLFEGAGALMLTLRWWNEHGLGRAAYLGLFHSVSAVNNAGCSLFSDNLVRYRGDLVVNLVITALIIFGGLGFFVLREAGTVRSFDRMSLHTRLVLVITGALLVGGTAILLTLERTNPRTLGSLGWGESFLAAWFQSVTSRTAGFNTIDLGGMHPASLFVVMALMMIGASPGSTGGGVKTTTFGVTVLALWATVRGAPEPVVFRRRLPGDLVQKSFFICLIAFLALNAIAGALLIVERQDLLRTLIETTSAFGTVGLSMGFPGSVLSLAGQFSVAGKLLLIVMMFAGRVGPLTLAVALAGRSRVTRFRYPEGKVAIG